MHQLTIDHNNRSTSISEHPNYEDAQRALLAYVVGADYYLCAVQNTAAHTSYELLRLADINEEAPSRNPSVTGVATIEPIGRVPA